jgi:hypothetical protein
VYEVEYAPNVERQIDELPSSARQACRAAVEELRRDPWRGERYSGHPPEFRTWPFGQWGLVVYVVLDRAVRVVVLQVGWAG